ncbi:hypothetical protein JCM17845_24830 [Iodidimonas gelatinilytica]|uniref:RNA-binding protein AU-1/Ribonuclease E/G domain-containing protein n=1 Tax=Iodidimonas gelatinilytica TaxID=1236966 RepID=A0A5A7N3A2_9PROT|nr:ribonuclease E/G [Iodidimonas gelatinilytica]GER01860.1 hypothetical protein JCM17845_24830 [Iodidimonas gelatinilytica]
MDEIAKGEIALPSGGRISFEDTRAAMVIDVDAGAACTGRSVARVARMVNLEAATAIALLLRRANIGGLVLVDFIDMAKHDDREAVLSALDAGFKADPAPIRRSKINHHGVLSITRKRTGLSVRDQMVAKSVSLPKLENSLHDLLRRAERTAIMDQRPGTLHLAAAPALAEKLRAGEWLALLAQRTARSVDLKDRADLSPDDGQCWIG